MIDLEVHEEIAETLGLAFFELGKEFERLPRSAGPSFEESLKREMNILDNGIEAFRIATGITSSGNLDVPTIAALCATNRSFRDKLQALVGQALRETKSESGGAAGSHVDKSEMLASLAKVSAATQREGV